MQIQKVLSEESNSTLTTFFLFLCSSTLLFFGPVPLGTREGSKGQISLNFKYEVNLKDFYTLLCGSCHRGGT